MWLANYGKWLPMLIGLFRGRAKPLSSAETLDVPPLLTFFLSSYRTMDTLDICLGSSPLEHNQLEVPSGDGVLSRTVNNWSTTG